MSKNLIALAGMRAYYKQTAARKITAYRTEKCSECGEQASLTSVEVPRTPSVMEIIVKLGITEIDRPLNPITYPNFPQTTPVCSRCVEKAEAKQQRTDALAAMLDKPLYSDRVSVDIASAFHLIELSNQIASKIDDLIRDAVTAQAHDEGLSYRETEQSPQAVRLNMVRYAARGLADDTRRTEEMLKQAIGSENRGGYTRESLLRRKAQREVAQAQAVALIAQSASYLFGRYGESEGQTAEGWNTANTAAIKNAAKITQPFFEQSWKMAEAFEAEKSAERSRENEAARQAKAATAVQS